MVGVMELSRCQWRRTKKGAYVVCGPFSLLADRDDVAVYQKDGRVRRVEIDRLGTPFTVDGVRMVYGYPRSQSSVAVA